MSSPHAPALDAFLDALRDFPDQPSVFNPWRHVDPLHDSAASAPETRVQNLRSYLAERVGQASLVLCAEALGYQGGHFSGIAMTSERMLVGNAIQHGVRPADIFEGAGERRCRTSRVGPCSVLGVNEPTASIVWRAIKHQARSTREVVLWNAFAFHPMKTRGDGSANWLSNRKPTAGELNAAAPLLGQFLSLFSGAQVVAIGRVAEAALKGQGVQLRATLRHPANGGAPAFRQGFAALCRS